MGKDFVRSRTEGSRVYRVFGQTLGLLLSLSLAACVPSGASSPEGSGGPPKLPGRSPRKPVFDFPGGRGPEAPAPKLDPLLGENTPPITEWTFASASASNEPWNASLTSVVSGSPTTVDPKLNCVASEVAKTLARFGSLGDGRFRVHLGLHCGLSSPDFNLQYASGSAPAQLSNLKLWRGVSHEDLTKAVDWLVKAGAARVGIGLAREGSKVSWTIVGQREGLKLEETRPAPDASNLVHIKGSSKGSVEHLHVVINYGEFGTKRCNVATEKNEFFATCPMDPKAESASFEVLQSADDRLLFRGVARGEARRSPATSTYQRPPEGDESAGSFAESAAEELNRARAASGLDPLKLSQPQSREAQAFLPHLAIAPERRDANRENNLTLGLLAGWKLKSQVRDGQSFIYAASTQSPRAWMRECLESPMARSVLLDPESDVLSVAGMPWGTHGTTGIAIAYSLYGNNDDHKADVDLALKRLHGARIAAGMPPFKVAPPTAELEEAALAIRDRGVAPEGALDYAAASLAQTGGLRVRAFHVEGFSFDSLTFPPEMLQLRNTTVRAIVTHYRPDKAAWNQMSLLILLESDE